MRRKFAIDMRPGRKRREAVTEGDQRREAVGYVGSS